MYMCSPRPSTAGRSVLSAHFFSEAREIYFTITLHKSLRARPTGGGPGMSAPYAPANQSLTMWSAGPAKFCMTALELLSALLFGERIIDGLRPHSTTRAGDLALDDLCALPSYGPDGARTPDATCGHLYTPATPMVATALDYRLDR